MPRTVKVLLPSLVHRGLGKGCSGPWDNSIRYGHTHNSVDKRKRKSLAHKSVGMSVFTCFVCVVVVVVVDM